jgi:hypothetical protein
MVTDSQNQVASDRKATNVEEQDGPLSSATDQEPVIASPIDRSGIDGLFESHDLLDNNQSGHADSAEASTVGRTSPFEDYDDTADD